MRLVSGIPFLSIITVCLNNLSGLKRTAESVKDQDSKLYEWIVIDGGSNDGISSYLETTTAQWVSEPDQGIYDAMNKGLTRARGEYVIFMNAGDVFAQCEIVSQIYKHTQKNIHAFIYGDALEDGQYKSARDLRNYKSGMFTHHQAMIYKRSRIGDLRYDTSYKIAADYKFTVQLLKDLSQGQTLYFPEALCIFETGGVSQINARLGRWEQFKIRRELGIGNLLVNSLIYVMQTMVLKLRRFFPKLYWFLKNRLK